MRRLAPIVIAAVMLPSGCCIFEADAVLGDEFHEFLGRMGDDGIRTLAGLEINCYTKGPDDLEYSWLHVNSEPTA
jgi:hypothetical protein